MAANFYDNSGMMAGCDLHKYFPVGPPPTLTGPPIPLHPHFVAAPFFKLEATFWKRTGTVKSGNWQMIQGSFDIYFVTHVPLPVPPPGAGEGPQIVDVVVASGSKAQLTAHSVTGQGSALATCIVSAFGLNLNCQEKGVSAPTGIVLNINSVETSPTAGDYAGAIAGWIVDSSIGYAMDKKQVNEIRKHIWRRIGDVPILKIADVPSHVQTFVQRWVDGSFGEAVEGFVGDVGSELGRIKATIKEGPSW